ncbi:hypothetical protein [Novipirellula artificiosorum]|uniref:Uncharacterized protein n=1 Tax=Novipirellula artificiosorum TaxID=2528016 RepID=A0A5C6DFU7_9BACT|nr:hypothetical protein [Novipirellula artificiosorum]TWU33859.1 hypothetical protein Poly41_48590 [Novipirellula artificiosorum]
MTDNGPDETTSSSNAPTPDTESAAQFLLSIRFGLFVIPPIVSFVFAFSMSLYGFVEGHPYIIYYFAFGAHALTLTAIWIVATVVNRWHASITSFWIAASLAAVYAATAAICWFLIGLPYWVLDMP